MSPCLKSMPVFGQKLATGLRWGSRVGISEVFKTLYVKI